MSKPKEESTKCATCGHDRSFHYRKKGSCYHKVGHRYCGCSRFRRLQWGEIRLAIIDSELFDVRFRTHADPYDGGKLNQRIEVKRESDHAPFWGVCERFTEYRVVVVKRADVIR